MYDCQYGKSSYFALTADSFLAAIFSSCATARQINFNAVRKYINCAVSLILKFDKVCAAIQNIYTTLRFALSLWSHYYLALSFAEHTVDYLYIQNVTKKSYFDPTEFALFSRDPKSTLGTNVKDPPLMHYVHR